MAFPRLYDERTSLGFFQIVSIYYDRLARCLQLIGSAIIGIVYVASEIGFIAKREWLLPALGGIIIWMLFDICRAVQCQCVKEFYGRQDEMYHRLLQEIDGCRPKRVTLIQYSGTYATEVIKKALRCGAIVSLYVQHPEKAINREQADRIKMFLRQLPSQTGNSPNCHIFLYEPHASLKAVVIDNELIALGWYVYLNRDRNSNPNYADPIDLRGHNKAGVLLKSECRGYAEVKNMVDSQIENLSLKAVRLEDVPAIVEE